MKRIVVENISKKYHYQSQDNKEMSFRELLSSQVTSLFRPAKSESTFYALQDVSFDVEEGEVFGIIGKNGSGKSTLLKILSRVTTPTSGRAVIRGRIASLLEVGTGFHAELSGRENIFLSGIILGMKRWEISQYFDEIVEFAGVGKFLDTPVKRYSSGMRLRLAFAVAVYLRPEVLLIDEVLAVGDYEFEKKCLASVNDLGKSGRSVVFVSHNLLAMKRLCSRIMVLSCGVQKFIGDPIEATKMYLGGEMISRSSMVWEEQGLVLGTILSLHSLKVAGGAEGDEQVSFFLDQQVIIEVTYTWLSLDDRISLVFSFYDETETLLFSTSKMSDEFEQGADETRNGSLQSIVLVVPGNIFQEGVTTVGMTIFNLGKREQLLDFDQTALFFEQELLSFFMKERDSQKIIGSGSFWRGQKGKMRPLVQWKA